MYFSSIISKYVLSIHVFFNVVEIITEDYLTKLCSIAFYANEIQAFLFIHLMR